MTPAELGTSARSRPPGRSDCAGFRQGIDRIEIMFKHMP